MNIEHEQRMIVTDIAITCKGATNLEINSREYADDAETLDLLVTELARLHPRWAEGKTTILGREDGLPPLRETNGEDPLILMYERTESLWWAWKNLRATNPTIDSLMRGVPEFTKALSSLLVGGRELDE